MTMQYSSSVTVDNLFATSVIPVVTDVMEVAASQTLKRGALLDATGTLCIKGAEVYAVLAEDITTTESPVKAAVYLTGEFNEKALSSSETAPVKSLKASARKVCIFIKPCM